MAKVKNKRKFNKVPEKADKSIFEPGDYPAKITGTELKSNSSKTGKVLSIEWTLTQERKGRKVWANLNLDNPSEQAEDIAWSEYKSIHKACGFDDFVDDSQELHDIEHILTLVIEEATNQKGKGKGKGKGKMYPPKMKPVGYSQIIENEGGKGGKNKKDKKGKGKGKKDW